MTLIAAMSTNGQNTFLGDLIIELSQQDKYQIERSDNDGGADLIVREPHTGKVVAVELKDAGTYGELPISTILPISRIVKQTDQLQKLLLITFSQVPVLLSKKLKELNVDALSRPTVDQVVEHIEQAFSA